MLSGTLVLNARYVKYFGVPSATSSHTRSPCSSTSLATASVEEAQPMRTLPPGNGLRRTREERETAAHADVGLHGREMRSRSSSDQTATRLSGRATGAPAGSAGFTHNGFGAQAPLSKTMMSPFGQLGRRVLGARPAVGVSLGVDEGEVTRAAAQLPDDLTLDVPVVRRARDLEDRAEVPEGHQQVPVGHDLDRVHVGVVGIGRRHHGLCRDVDVVLAVPLEEDVAARADVLDRPCRSSRWTGRVRRPGGTGSRRAAGSSRGCRC